MRPTLVYRSLQHYMAGKESTVKKSHRHNLRILMRALGLGLIERRGDPCRAGDA